MRYILAFLCCAGSLLTGRAQMKNTIKGRVVNGESGEAIPAASVFVTNTSKGTTSGNDGVFELNDVPEGSYDLVVSCVGFETLVYSYQATQLPLHLEMRLKPKVQELPDVVVEPDEKNGWEKWGAFFTDNFLGTSDMGRKCRIINYKTLRFRYSKSKKLLHVLADDPLIIDNKALGYRVKFQLEDFHFNFNAQMLVFYGYSLFTELNDKGPSKEQIANREKAYNGSVLHFMRSLYHDTLFGEGFEVRRYTVRPNTEKQRVRRLFPQIPPDSAAYYDRVMKQDDMITEYSQSFLTADSLLTKPDSVGNRRLFFTDHLFIFYRKGKEELDYLNFTHELRRLSLQHSSLVLTGSIPITIEATGNYYPPQRLLMDGYWSWTGKIGNLLPLDYKRNE